MPGRTSLRSQRYGSLGFNKSTNKAPPGAPLPDKKQELKEHYDPAVPQQENINANTQPKLREPMRNLMFDPRVVRGSQFPHKPKPPEEPWSTPRRVVVSKTKKPNTVRYSDEPAPIKGRKHCDIQTDVYLEELTDKIPDFDADTQTDPFLDRPATPLFIPWKSGPDKWTQIYEGDLFDFDMEVEAMLEVLCGRTIEQAVMEVMEDHQLAHIRMHQDRFEQLRIAEMVAAEQLEAAHKRAIEEKERRKEQEKKRLMEEKRLRERLEAENFTRQYLHELKEEVMEDLRRKGWFFDPRQREIETIFIPSMLEGVWTHVEDIIRSRFALSYMVDGVLLPVEEMPPETGEDQDLDLDRMDDVIEAEDMFGNVIRQVERPTVCALHDAVETQEVRHYTPTNLLGEMTTETVAGAINLAEEASHLVDLMLAQLRPPAPS
ncbi:unnamed protein product [Calypogeia fissa]